MIPGMSATSRPAMSRVLTRWMSDKIAIGARDSNETVVVADGRWLRHSQGSSR